MACPTIDIKHTLFLGCSVVAFTGNGGLNEQQSEITIRLVQDVCPANELSPKYFYDDHLNEQTTLEADPGFIGEYISIVGMPAYFRFGDFEFAGLIQSWEKSRSDSANPEYIVKLVSPVRVLQDTNLIISKYSGALLPNDIFSNAPNNLVNVYGFLEGVNGVDSVQVSQDPDEIGSYIPGDVGIDGAIFGTAAGGFGGSNLNNNGVKWDLIKNAVSSLTSAIPAVQTMWSPHGRITHRGVNPSLAGDPWHNCYGLMCFDGIVNALDISQYCVDLSELPPMPDYYRINADVISLLDLITKICQDSGYDYYVELLPIKTPLTDTGVLKMIKLRTISRNLQPIGGQISQFVENLVSSERLISSSIGQELRNDITSAFLFGGPKESVYQAYQNDDPDGLGEPLPSGQSQMIIPYYGQDSTNNMIMPRWDGDQWMADFESDILQSKLFVIDFSGYPLTIGDRELASALVSMDEWETFTANNETDTYVWTRLSDISDTYNNLQTAWGFLTDKINSRQVRKKQRAITNLDAANVHNRVDNLKRIGQGQQNAFSNNLQQDRGTIYSFVQNIATEYFGKAWAVRVPNVSAYLDSESNTVIYSDEPGQDGGWTEMSGVLGIPNPSTPIQFFSNERNKIQPFLAFNTFPNLDLIADGDTLTYNDISYIRCNVDDKYVFADRLNLTLPRIVARTNESILEALDQLLANIGGLENFLQTTNLTADEREDLRLHLGTTVSEQLNFYRHVGLNLHPMAAALPIKSNILSYGPWSSVGPPGGVHIEQNDGLVPWEYGSIDTMNTAAGQLVNVGLSNMQVAEVGSVNLAYYPELPLGAEINSSSFINGQHLIENRTLSFGNYGGSIGGNPFNYQYVQHSYGAPWQGLYGPNITDITVNVGESITTSYTMQTYSPKWGKFSELNSYRLKQIGQNRLEIIRRVNNILAQKALGQSTREGRQLREKNLGDTVKKTTLERKKFTPRTPHQILVGEVYLPEGSGFYSGITGIPRTLVGTYSANDIAATFREYERKAYMSMDGIFRPVSMQGEGSLPRYFNFNPTGSGTTNNSLIFKIDVSGNFAGTGTASAAALTLFDLNPLQNPTGYQFSQLASRHTGTAGHDIEIVGRGTGFPQSGLLMPSIASGTEVDYRNDYRFIAMRGPLVMQGWGFDTAGKPIPNQVDTTGGMYSGVYQSTGLSNNFFPDFLQDPRTWPVAPVELVFDRGRGLWVAPTTERLTTGILMNHLGLGQPARVRLTDTGTYFYDSTGMVTGYSIISGWTTLNNLYASGCQLEFKYDSTDSKWKVNKDSHVSVLITGTVSGATWDRNITGIKPIVFSAPMFGPSVDPSGFISGFLQYRTGIMVTGWNRYTSALTPGNSQAYIANIVNGWVEGADCLKVTYV